MAAAAELRVPETSFGIHYGAVRTPLGLDKDLRRARESWALGLEGPPRALETRKNGAERSYWSPVGRHLLSPGTPGSARSSLLCRRALCESPGQRRTWRPAGRSLRRCAGGHRPSDRWSCRSAPGARLHHRAWAPCRGAVPSSRRGSNLGRPRIDRVLLRGSVDSGQRRLPPLYGAGDHLRRSLNVLKLKSFYKGQVAKRPSRSTRPSLGRQPSGTKAPARRRSSSLSGWKS